VPSVIDGCFALAIAGYNDGKMKTIIILIRRRDTKGVVLRKSMSKKDHAVGASDAVASAVW